MENYISALNSQWHPDCFVCRVSYFWMEYVCSQVVPSDASAGIPLDVTLERTSVVSSGVEEVFGYYTTLM